MDRQEIMKQRRSVFDKLERQLHETQRPEDFMFYYHPNEEHIVLSHALFWVMSRPFVKKLPDLKTFLLLRRYQEEMLEAYLTESPDFAELLRYCNLSYEVLPHELGLMAKDFVTGSTVRRLMAIGVVAAGYGGDMPDDQAYELLDDIDFHYNKVCCPLIEQQLPYLQKLVLEQEKDLLLKS
ncbi:hypothetical protein [uncultured Bacteroides sp.]|jgi:hypothetical protein|uniref:hypothetical protein n=1 Tax=uncultured Bacteroides sp. TaxID=162156 RepID=UPI00262E71DC|nr:hypothetical protein [uncultured Bacteroides sp.]